MESRISGDMDSPEQKVTVLGGRLCGWQAFLVAIVDDPARKALLRRGFALEYATLAWNVAGIVVLAIAAIAARSVALAGFGLDSLIEIGASTVVIWELSGTGEQRQRRGLRLIGYAFAALAVYLLVQSTVVLAAGYHPRHSAARHHLDRGDRRGHVPRWPPARPGPAGRWITRCCGPRAGSR